MTTGTSHLSELEIKRKGAHYTPPMLASFLAERAVAALDAGRRLYRILDPACGDGELLQAVVAAIPPNCRNRVRLAGYELDDIALRNANHRLSKLPVVFDIRKANFLEAYGLDDGAGLFAGDISRPDSYDIVISNPPYVRTQVLGAAKAKDLARRFGLTGRVDLYHAFVVAMWAALAPKGVLALLTSNRFMTIQSGASMRRLLRESFRLHEVFDLGDTKLFEAAVLPAIVIGTKMCSGDEAIDEPAFGRVYEDRMSLKPETVFESPLEALRQRHTGTFGVGPAVYRSTSGSLRLSGAFDQPWVLDSEESRGWLASVERHTAYRFGDVAEVRVGIKTTADNVFIRDDWSNLPPEVRPEPSLIKPLLTHHIARKWSIHGPTKASVLYPHYADENGRRQAVALEDFPSAGQYFESHRRQLAGRKYVEDAGRAWYEIWVPQQPADWALPKVVYPDIAESPMFFFDDRERIVNGDCYWIVLKERVEPDWLFLLLGIANSSFSVAYYDAIFHNKLYAGRRRFMTQYVRQFPLPAIESPNAKELVALVKRRIAAGKPEAGFDERVNERAWACFGITSPDTTFTAVTRSFSSTRMMT